MKKSCQLLLAGAVLLSACAGSRPASTNGPAIMGSTSVGQDYYEKARQTVPPFVLQEISTDSSYAFTSQNPVKVGGAFEGGARNQQRYLNALRGPGGQPVRYRRQGSCCLFKTPNGMNNMGLLDAYEVTWEGNPTPRVLYLNFYDDGWLKAPKGFTIAQGK